MRYPFLGSRAAACVLFCQPDFWNWFLIFERSPTFVLNRSSVPRLPTKKNVPSSIGRKLKPTMSEKTSWIPTKVLLTTAMDVVGRLRG